MHVPTARPLTRRALFGLVGVGSLAALTSCSAFGDAPATITVTADATTQPTASGDPAPDPTVLLGLVFTTRLHVEHLISAIAVDERDAPLFTTLLADRQAHLAALEAEYSRQFGTAPTAPATSSETSTGIEPDPDEIIGRIRGDATDAQSKFTDALASASRFQAQLFGSIAACIATHRMVLS